MTSRGENQYEEIDVLVVEDDEFQRSLIVQALQVLGFPVIREAGDGEEGLKACVAKLPGLILCDIEMQPMDGMAFLKALRRTKSAAVREIPIVFLTSHNESETVQEAVAAGVDAFIIKPLTLKKLKGRLDAIFANPRF
ncbi:response regulator [Nisaea sp.]|uniref:response regulator n=1 Tax=Nisaea sp. TaxID=2024842 RepID=UPI002B26B584|nr:response regulator [Nisaea sp.]